MGKFDAVTRIQFHQEKYSPLQMLPYQGTIQKG